MKRLLAGVVLVVAALPALGERLPNDPRGDARRDAVAPGSLAGLMRPAPEAGDPRVWYFVVLQGKDPDFEALGAQVEASWKNRRLVRVPPQAVQGLARHPDVQYLQRIDEPGTQGSRGAVAELSVGAESGSGQPSGHAELGTLTWTSGAYGYDGAGNIVSIGPDHYEHLQNYTYDGLGRLTTGTAHTRNGDHLESYGYDVYGNLIEKLTDGSGGPPLSVNPATNQLQGATYDVAGNMASYGSNEYFWDAGGMLKETWYGAVGQKGYVYTPDEERLGVVTSEANYWTWTVRDGSGKVIREYESAGGEFQYAPWLWIEDYAHGLGRLLVSEREGAEGGRRHYHVDHLGSTRFVTTEDGVPGVTAGDGYRATEHVYFPFGLDATELRQEHGLGFRRETRLKYTGHERDYMAGEFVENTNYLDYMHARYYNPNLGRFLSVDPGGFKPERPQSWNRYTYSANNPIVFVDPDGREEKAFVLITGTPSQLNRHAAMYFQDNEASPKLDRVFSHGGQTHGVRSLSSYLSMYNADRDPTVAFELNLTDSQAKQLRTAYETDYIHHKSGSFIAQDPYRELSSNCAQKVCAKILEANVVTDSQKVTAAQVLGEQGLMHTNQLVHFLRRIGILKGDPGGNVAPAPAVRLVPGVDDQKK